MTTTEDKPYLTPPIETNDPYLRDLHKLACLVEHRAKVLRKSIEQDGPRYATTRYQKMGEAWAAFKRLFKGGPLDAR